jgi:hypothetical protein
MTTKEKGDVAVGFAISHFMSQGYEVCLLIGDKRPYDFILEKNENLSRVQVKYVGSWERNGPCIANLRTMGGNQSFYTAKKYSDGDFDILFVRSQKEMNYCIPGVKFRQRVRFR